jgi:hypothetical protein
LREKKTKLIFVPALLLSLALGSFLLFGGFSGLVAAPAQQTREAGGITLSGFAPGTKVTYQGAAGGDVSASGEFEIDGKGFARLPALELPKDAPPGDISYTITIETFDPDLEEPGEPIKILVTVDEETRAVSMKGIGFGRFSDLKIFGGGVTEEIKADWAGMFDMQGVATLDGFEAGEPLKLAFQNFSTAVDATPEQSPSIVEIQVLMTPGVGGGPTPLGVNSYSATGCSDDVEHSICDDDHIDRTIEDIVEFVVVPLVMMGEQLSAVMHYWTLPVGTMLDAKIQMEIQRSHQELQAEAVKDYHPSEMMCRFGSFVKSVAQTEEKAQQNKQALNRLLTERYSNTQSTSGTEGYETDMKTRLVQFRGVYCDPRDNNNALASMCDHDQAAGGPAGGTNRIRMNKDIDYTRTLNNPLTLDVDFTNAGVPTDDEADVIALARNLYWPRTFAIALKEKVEDSYQVYLQARHHQAVQSVAHNSYVSIVGEKSSTVDTVGANSGWAYMKALLRELDLNDDNASGSVDDEIHGMLGNNPSYYAQMEMLTKKLYQHPDFYTNLYDKPVNVERIKASMDAIGLMHNRDRFESSLRREMLTSLLVEQALRRHQEETNVHLFSGMKESQR